VKCEGVQGLKGVAPKKAIRDRKVYRLEKRKRLPQGNLSGGTKTGSWVMGYQTGGVGEKNKSNERAAEPGVPKKRKEKVSNTEKLFP